MVEMQSEKAVRYHRSVNFESNSFDLPDLDRDIPTTPEDIRALRENRPRMPENWWDILTQASEQLPGVQEARKRRKTFEGWEPFEL